MVGHGDAASAGDSAVRQENLQGVAREAGQRLTTRMQAIDYGGLGALTSSLGDGSLEFLPG